MTNEQKATEIAEYNDENYIHRYAGAMQMAKWKDEQFMAEKTALIDKIVEEFDFHNLTYIDVNGKLTFDYGKFF